MADSRKALPPGVVEGEYQARPKGKRPGLAWNTARQKDVTPRVWVSETAYYVDSYEFFKLFGLELTPAQKKIYEAMRQEATRRKRS